MDTRFPYSPAEVAKVRMVQFGILSPDEIVTLAANYFPLFFPFAFWGIVGKQKKILEIYDS